LSNNTLRPENTRLHFGGCINSIFTENAMPFLREIQHLDLAGTNLSIENKDLCHLKGIKSIDFSMCNQVKLDDNSLMVLDGGSIEELKLYNCEQITITKQFKRRLKNINRLEIENCNIVTLMVQ
jgi:hypothetical protein